ncbi:2-oxo-4-hydroxy-4-carboxy-5-ureidoimidazoline decarboxylase [Noviherbaspirillum galbum]|uniref:2-oxo-4-hydroxy-4-carboxy-5-ureidoimidazoline decarboxylase n=1 Tax=Noviherbaspirillum galbum TaxID=2709383 RepID=A0A6B3SVZ7_9BURK|nr:2-oxo-4-hydroxy-4-carboxy-5-ureidoimidazoline decarboxylase [Noviherbaspirillum galbum]NEX62562.1 2-oxo-4-hydroxy-4-carboxy-5-ureidoimidazoline decarboxylase [Noviherbaspirillum galbum]
MNARITLAALNAMPPEVFAATLGAIYEHSPWFAERAAEKRPFDDLEQLQAAMASEVCNAAVREQLDLLLAHPELAGKAAIRGELTAESTREQKGAGLDQCTPEEFDRLQALNRAYREKFGFPFIIAVKGHTRQSILAAMSSRLQHDRERELRECVEQVIQIGRFRIAELVGA